MNKVLGASDGGLANWDKPGSVSPHEGALTPLNFHNV